MAIQFNPLVSMHSIHFPNIICYEKKRKILIRGHLQQKKSHLGPRMCLPLCNNINRLLIATNINPKHSYYTRVKVIININSSKTIIIAHPAVEPALVVCLATYICFIFEGKLLSAPIKLFLP